MAKTRFYIYLCLALSLFSSASSAQQLGTPNNESASISEELASSYYRNGEFKKALISYQQLLQQKPYNLNFVYKVIDIYQQLEDYQNADAFIKNKLARFKTPALLIELGYNFQVQDSLARAERYYNEALRSLDQNPNFVYSVTRQFEKHSLLEEALEAYETATLMLPDKNFNIQMARIYGEQGNIEKMFTNYIDYIYFKPNFMNNTKRAFNDFITEDPENPSNQLLRKLLLKRIQTNPDDVCYQLLSWLYVQQRQYNKSFVQEKALYRRNPESLERIFELGIFALEDNKNATAQSIFEFLLDSAQDLDTQLTAHQYILEIRAQVAEPNQLERIKTDYQTLFDTYGLFEPTVGLQLAYGDFLAFNMKETEAASKFLKQSLKLNISPYQEGLVKLKLGDILVLQERFNEALIYFTQIQANLKNSTLAQEARYKVAKTSFYKGDFDWAESQLKILKSATSQLIANDALDLKLLISDHKYEDSTQTALKLYAKADLLAYQKNTSAAIKVIDTILSEHKGETIIDEALLTQARWYTELQEFEKAAANYQNIIADYPEDILVDDAYFRLAELYRNQLDRPEDAKPLYEKIIFEHEDSIYFVEARKQYRILRGDNIE